MFRVEVSFWSVLSLKFELLVEVSGSLSSGSLICEGVI